MKHLSDQNNIAIVGFTSGMISDITDPSLTSVEQHGYTIGEEAVKLLIGRIEGKKEMPFETKVIRTELVIKDSTKRDLTIPDNIKEIKKKSLFLG
jgi:LacI family transcriptional regulator